MKKMITVVGARPQFVKAAVVSRAIREVSSIHEQIVHTGQHYDHNMSDLFFDDLKVPKPKYNLGVGSGLQGKQTALMIDRLEEVFKKEKPAAILIYGDTNSTLAAAIAGSKLHIPIAHVEAGMRSFNKKMSEEVNRVVTDHLSHWLFCSSQVSVKNLEREGLKHTKSQMPKVWNVGDVMIDALRFFDTWAMRHSSVLKKLKLKTKDYYLLTVHRAENTDNPKKLKIIIEAINRFSNKGNTIIFPVHPRTFEKLKNIQYRKPSSHFHYIKPVSYFDMLQLEKYAKGIITDSGGIQKEAYFFGIPTVTLRDQTEWTETVECGLNELVPIESNKIQQACEKFSQKNNKTYENHIYGDGRAAERIVKLLHRYL